MKSNIIIMGVKHCGKSTLGRMLAEKLNYRFIDIDDLMEKLPIADGLSAKEIYRKKGAKAFKECEAGAVVHFQQNMPPGPYVIAPGGGIIENQAAMAVLKELGKMIFLHADADLLFRRIMRKGVPAFISDDKPYEHFLEVYTRRTKLYEEAAHFILDIRGKERDESLELLQKAAKQLLGAGE